MKLYLIGFRGVGKSTVGRSLAQQWQLNFLDLDEIFEKKFGPISNFVEKNGIEAFREQESLILEESAQANNVIVATGGGCVDWAASRAFLESLAAPKVLLEADVEEIWQRLRSPEKRKVLDLQTFEQVAALFQQREPFYHKIATFRVASRDITHALIELEKLRDRLWQAAP